MCGMRRLVFKDTFLVFRVLKSESDQRTYISNGSIQQVPAIPTAPSTLQALGVGGTPSTLVV
jgi:hypothetical protein